MANNGYKEVALSKEGARALMNALSADNAKITKGGSGKRATPKNTTKSDNKAKK